MNERQFIVVLWFQGVQRLFKRTLQLAVVDISKFKVDFH